MSDKEIMAAIEKIEVGLDKQQKLYDVAMSTLGRVTVERDHYRDALKLYECDCAEEYGEKHSDFCMAVTKALGDE